MDFEYLWKWCYPNSQRFFTLTPSIAGLGHSTDSGTTGVTSSGHLGSGIDATSQLKTSTHFTATPFMYSFSWIENHSSIVQILMTGFYFFCIGKQEREAEARLEVEKQIMERDAFILSKKLRETSLTLAEKDREVLLRNERGEMSRTQRLSTNVGLMPSTHLFILFFFFRSKTSNISWKLANG